MIRGMTLDAVEEPSQEAMARLAGLGVDHITLIPFGFQRRHNDPNLSFNPEPGWYSDPAGDHAQTAYRDGER
ncbi:MAG: hypothetical protein IIC18_01600 [Bacteroidetes bacterium]|nr:hypothetical protein [Bacteroidota bacterium]